MTAARRLAAILAADVVGYSRLMGEDETDTPKPQVGPTSRAVNCTTASQRRLLLEGASLATAASRAVGALVLGGQEGRRST
jgi:hypothetical protein